MFGLVSIESDTRWEGLLPELDLQRLPVCLVWDPDAAFHRAGAVAFERTERLGVDTERKRRQVIARRA
jgi:hypothetical protein